MARIPKRAALNIEDFQYLEQTKLPALILGIHIPYDHFRSDSGRTHSYRFKRGREWGKIAHEAFGTQHFWIGTVIAPKPEVARLMSRVVEEQGELEMILGTPSLLQLRNYSSALKELLGVDCNVTYPLFGAHHYPIDACYIHHLAGESLPANLDEFVDWESGLERAAGAANRWGAVILA